MTLSKRRLTLPVRVASLPTRNSTSNDFAFASAAPPARYDNLLVLVELKGGNDGFNTLVPFGDAGYTGCGRSSR